MENVEEVGKKSKGKDNPNSWRSKLDHLSVIESLAEILNRA
jgi:hypothetical protein